MFRRSGFGDEGSGLDPVRRWMRNPKIGQVTTSMVCDARDTVICYLGPAQEEEEKEAAAAAGSISSSSSGSCLRRSSSSSSIRSSSSSSRSSSRNSIQ